MTIVRLTEEDVLRLDDERLIGDFEVGSRRAFDPSLSIFEQEEESKNLNTLRQEILRRMK